MERLSTETARKSLAAATLAFLPPVPKEAINSPALTFSSLPSILLLPRIPFLFWLLPICSYILDISTCLCIAHTGCRTSSRNSRIGDRPWFRLPYMAIFQGFNRFYISPPMQNNGSWESAVLRKSANSISNLWTTVFTDSEPINDHVSACYG